MNKSSDIVSSRDLKLPYDIAYGPDIKKIQICVDNEFISWIHTRLDFNRYVDIESDGGQTELPDGTLTAKQISDYWQNKYNWLDVENTLNKDLQHFSVLIDPSPGPSGFEATLPIHFVHHRSERKDAIPLLFVHGWPGSFLEVEPMIKELTSPTDPSAPAFHVVAPSIPGYGFSPSPSVPDMGYRACAAIFHALMLKLGYSKFTFQAGDAGALITRYMAHDFQDSVTSGLSNFWIIPPPPKASNVSNEDEIFARQALDQFFAHNWAYAYLQQTRPLKLAHAITDSPIGLAMWIYDSVVQGIEPARIATIWTEERVITWTMMHFLNGPYGAYSLYKWGAAKDGAIDSTGINLLPYVSQPIAVSQFPYDIGYRTPLEWLSKGGNVVRRTVHQKGGHFPSVTDTETLVQDIRSFFGDKDLSRTHVFG